MAYRWCSMTYKLYQGIILYGPCVRKTPMLLRSPTLVELQNAGRWTDSKMPAHYTRKQAASKGAVARLFGADEGSTLIDTHS